MKKILLLMCLIITSSLFNFSYADSYIAGPTQLYGNSGGYYFVDGIPSSKSISTVTWTYSSGAFNLIDGGGYHDTYINLDALNNYSGYTELSATIMYSDFTQSYVSINILIKPKSLVELIGPTTIGTFQSATYKAINQDLYDIIWNFDSKYFSLEQGGSQNDATIKVKAKNKTGRTPIYVQTFNKTNGVPVDEAYIYITIKDLYKISSTTSIICINNYTDYSIIGEKIPDNATITWQAGSNLTLVSGQGTSTATFKGSGNGKGVVKATVTYDGIDYPIENSDVWVGPPMAASGIGFIPNDPIIEIPQETPEYLCINKAFSNKNYIYSQITGGDLISNTEYQWIKKTNNFNLASTTFSKAMVVPTAKGDMIIEYTTKNKCGSMAGPIKYIIKATECDLNGNPINSGGGGGVITPPDDFIPMSRSSVVPQPTSIRIYSYPTGSLVYQKKNTISFDIQNTNLGEGIYILEMTDQQGNVTREKVIKGKQ